MPGLPTSLNLDAIATALGGAPRVSYEDVHVYPLSAPDFTSQPRAVRERPVGGGLKLYVHVPFCNYACTFCFYAKRVGVARAQMERYVAALARELEWVEPTTPLDQLYVGGGTPTALPADLLDEVLATIMARMPRAERASLTVECSPESLTDAHVRVLRERGVNRVSMGIQSLDPSVLDVINRRHGLEQALEACALLVAGGFFVNVDLIYGLPGQSEASFRHDLGAAAALRPHSFTLYNLRLNEFTPLATVVHDVERMDLAALVRWRDCAKRAAADLGYTQTRWHTFVHHDALGSSYDRAPCVDGYGAGRQLGIGMSAVSHLGNTVFRNHEGFESYMARVEGGESPVEGVFDLDDEDRRTLFIARSLGDGGSVDLAEYEQAFGKSIAADFGDLLERLGDAALVREEAGALSLTEGGKLVYDLVLLTFYPARAQRWLRERQSRMRTGSVRSGDASRPLAHRRTAIGSS